MNFGRAESQFVSVVVAGLKDSAQNIPELGLIADEAQQ